MGLNEIKDGRQHITEAQKKDACSGGRTEPVSLDGGLSRTDLSREERQSVATGQGNGKAGWHMRQWC